MDHIIHEIAGSDIRLSELMSLIETMQAVHPEWEVFMDGDRYAVVGRDRP